MDGKLSADGDQPKQTKEEAGADKEESFRHVGSVAHRS